MAKARLPKNFPGDSGEPGGVMWSRDLEDTSMLLGREGTGVPSGDQSWLLDPRLHLEAWLSVASELRSLGNENW